MHVDYSDSQLSDEELKEFISKLEKQKKAELAEFKERDEKMRNGSLAKCNTDSPKLVF